MRPAEAEAYATQWIRKGESNTALLVLPERLHTVDGKLEVSVEDGGIGTVLFSVYTTIFFFFFSFFARGWKIASHKTSLYVLNSYRVLLFSGLQATHDW